MQTHGPYTYKKIVKHIYIKSNNINKISQSEIVLINITLVSTIAK